MATGKQISEENKKAKGRIIDPTEDPQDLMNDTTGITGITTEEKEGDKNLENTAPGGDIFKEGVNTVESEQTKSKHLQSSVGENVRQGMSDPAAAAADDVASEPAPDATPDSPKGSYSENSINPPAEPQINADGNETINEASPPNVIGEQDESGDNPDPGSDDETLKNEHEVGLRLDEDEEHPKELDIAGDMDKAEEYQRDH